MGFDTGTQRAAFRFRTSAPDDDAALLALFRDVFGEDGTGDRTDATWRWRMNPPGGNRSCVALPPDDERVVAFVGGTRHATWWEGVTRDTLECVDHMVTPELRRGLRRTSLFAALKLHWFEEHCGRDRSFLAWGFPCENDFRVGQRFAGYSLLRTVNALVLHDASRVRETDRVVARRTDVFDPATDALWERCRDDLCCAVRRDREHLTWRYARCPHQEYQLLEARGADDGELHGLCVLRAGGLSPDIGMIMELLVPEDDEAARLALLGGAVRWARDQGLNGLAAWVPEPCRGFVSLQEAGFQVRATGMIMAARSWDPAVSLREVRARFHTSFGDMDAW